MTMIYLVAYSRTSHLSGKEKTKTKKNNNDNNSTDNSVRTLFTLQISASSVRVIIIAFHYSLFSFIQSLLSTS